jgi:hypothetical protein
MVEGPSGVSVTLFGHTMGQEFCLLASIRDGRHGMARTDPRGANIPGRYAGAAAEETVSARDAAKVRLGKCAHICPEIVACADRPGSTRDGATPLQQNERLMSVPATAPILNLLNCDQRDINFADHAARLELHSRRARELLREAFFDQKHPEASTRRLSNGRPSPFAPFEVKCTAALIDFRRDVHLSIGDCQRPVFARIRTQFIDRHNEGESCGWINPYRRGLDSELLATRRFKRFNRCFQQFRQHRARPTRPQKQVMDPT